MGILTWMRHRKKPLILKWERTRTPIASGQRNEPRYLENNYRFNLQHVLLRSLLNGDYTAPIPQSTRHILDIGCRTGLWVSEIAQQFPHAQVTGLDLELSHVQNHGLANCQFVTGNVLEGLPFAMEKSRKWL